VTEAVAYRCVLRKVKGVALILKSPSLVPEASGLKSVVHGSYAVGYFKLFNNGVSAAECRLIE
jgi:hypothetical protein